MKKGLFAFTFAAVLLVSCFAQSANNQSADSARRIVGTWDAIDSDGIYTAWVFSADGTLTINGSFTYRYAATATQLVTAVIFANGSLDVPYFNDYSMSSDGRTLIITGITNNSMYWLTKR